MTTEREILDMLGKKFGNAQAGNGPKYTIAEHVRSDLGHTAKRTLDFMTQALWHSLHARIEGYEVKCSRSDFLAELKDPTKAAAFEPYMNRFWLVVANDAIVKGDLPDTWGLMVKKGNGLTIVRQAPIKEPLPMPATMRGAWSRAVVKTERLRMTAQIEQALKDHTSGGLMKCERYINGYWCFSERTAYDSQLDTRVTRLLAKTPCSPCRLRRALDEHVFHARV